MVVIFDSDVEASLRRFLSVPNFQTPNFRSPSLRPHIYVFSFLDHVPIKVKSSNFMKLLREMLPLVGNK